MLHLGTSMSIASPKRGLMMDMGYNKIFSWYGPFLSPPKQVVFSLFFMAKYVWGSIFTLSFLEPNLQPICHEHVGSIILMIENVHLIKRVENISHNKIYIYLIVIYACSKHINLMCELVCFLCWSCICGHSININFCISIIFGVLYNVNISDHQNDGACMLMRWISCMVGWKKGEWH